MQNIIYYSIAFNDSVNENPFAHLWKLRHAIKNSSNRNESNNNNNGDNNNNNGSSNNGERDCSGRLNSKTMNQNWTRRHKMVNKFTYTHTTQTHSYDHLSIFRKLPYGHMPFINKTTSTATRHINIYLYLLHGSHRYSLCVVHVVVFFHCRDAAKSILLVLLPVYCYFFSPLLSFVPNFFPKIILHATWIFESTFSVVKLYRLQSCFFLLLHLRFWFFFLSRYCLH